MTATVFTALCIVTAFYGTGGRTVGIVRSVLSVTRDNYSGNPYHTG